MMTITIFRRITKLVLSTSSQTRKTCLLKPWRLAGVELQIITGRDKTKQNQIRNKFCYTWEICLVAACVVFTEKVLQYRLDFPLKSRWGQDCMFMPCFYLWFSGWWNFFFIKYKSWIFLNTSYNNCFFMLLQRLGLKWRESGWLAKQCKDDMWRVCVFVCDWSGASGEEVVRPY